MQRLMSHVLTEFYSMQDISQPIKTATRIKYTCISAARRYISLGTNTGTVYLFNADTLKCLQTFVGEMEGGVAKIEFSPDCNFLACGTNKGQVAVFQTNISQRNKAEKLRLSNDHRGHVITALRWNEAADHVYVGDDSGVVSTIFVTTSKTRDLLKIPHEIILKLDSSISQIDTSEDRILVSTLTKSYLCYTQREKFSQIGTKPRDGCYGACFYRGSMVQTPVIYSARPGSRIWEVDYDGNVLNTHQFKQLLAVPPSNVLSLVDSEKTFPGDVVPCAPQAMNFPTLQLLREQFLLTWSNRGIFVFNPVEVEVILWNKQYTDTIDISLCDNDLFLLNGQSSVTRLTFMTCEKLVQVLFTQQRWKLCANLCRYAQDYIKLAKFRTQIPETMLLTLKNNLTPDLSNLANQIDALINTLETPHVKSCNNNSPATSPINDGDSVPYEKLESGIYKIKSSTSLPLSRTPSSSSLQSTKSLNTLELCSADFSNSSDPKCTSHRTEQNVTSENSPVSFTIGQNESPTHSSSVSSDAHDSVSISSGEIKAESTAEVQETTKSTHQDTLHKVPSSGSVASLEYSTETKAGRRGSLTSMSSNELMFGLPDQEPIAVSVRKTKRASIATIVTVSNQNDDNIVVPTRRSRSKTVNVTRSVPRSLPVSSTTSSQLTHSSAQMPSPKASPGITRVSSSSSPSTTSMSSLPDADLASMEDTKCETVDEYQQSPRLSRISSLVAIKDSFSKKTKSFIQTVKDKTSQLGKSDRPEPLDVAPSRADASNVNDEPSQNADETSDRDHIDSSTDDKESKILAEKLTEQTKKTRFMLDDPEILYDCEKMKSYLSDWVNVLHETLLTLQLSKKQKTLKTVNTSEDPHKNESISIASSILNDIISDVIGINTDKTNDGENKVHSTQESFLDDTDNIKLCQRKSDFSLLWNTICLTDPFHLDDKAHTEVSELAMLCLETETYGSLSENIQTSIGTISNTSINPVQDTTYQRLDDCYTSQDQEAIINNCSRVFIRCYFHLLDLDKVRTVMCAWRRSYYATWKAYLECLSVIGHGDQVDERITDGDINGAFDILRSGSLPDKRPTLSHLTRLFGISPMMTLEFCALEYKLISYLEVLYMIDPSGSLSDYTKDEVHTGDETSVSAACQRVVSYTTQYMKSLPETLRSEIFIKLIEDNRIMLPLLKSFLQVELVEEAPLNCSCGMPRPRSHKAKWLHSTIIDTILQQAMKGDRRGKTMEKVIHICRDCGYWLGYLQLIASQSAETDMPNDTMKIALQLGDINFYQRQSSSLGSLLRTRLTTNDRWRNLLLLKQNQHQTISGLVDLETYLCLECKKGLAPFVPNDPTTNSPGSDSDSLKQISGAKSNWHEEVTWEKLAVLLVEDIGAGHAIEMLNELSPPDTALSFNFYQRAILCTVIEKQQRTLVHNILERMDTYMWAKQPTQLPPHLLYTVKEEKLQQVAMENESATAVPDVLLNEVSRRCTGNAQFVEKPDVHWGAVVDVNRECSNCNSSLGDTMSLDIPGVLVLNCGHAYHKCCLQDNVCSLCFTSGSYKALLHRYITKDSELTQDTKQNKYVPI